MFGFIFAEEKKETKRDSEDSPNGGDGAEGAVEMKNGPTEVSQFLRLTSAIFFGVSSFLLVVANKWILTSFRYVFKAPQRTECVCFIDLSSFFSRFPSVHCVGLSQMIATMTVLAVAKKLKIVDYPPLTMETVSQVRVNYSSIRGV